MRNQKLLDSEEEVLYTQPRIIYWKLNNYVAKYTMF